MSLELSGTTGVKGVAGSVSAPSIVGDDTNTGISFPSADTIKFSTGGVERMQITNSGVSGTGINILQQKLVKKTNTTSTSSNTIVETSSDFRTTITPISASSTILVQAILAIAMNVSDIITFRLARNTASDFSGTTTEFMTPDVFSNDNHGNLVYWNSAGFMDTIPLVAFETSGNTTARTYSPFWRVNAGTAYLNQYTSTGYTMTSVMTVTEIAA